jgi:hypothetical protein
LDKSASQPVSGLHKTFFRLPLGRGAVGNWAAAEETVGTAHLECTGTGTCVKYSTLGTRKI